MKTSPWKHSPYLCIATLFFSTVAQSSVTPEHGAHSLDFNGYLRTGIGVSEGGTSQARYIAPSARAKYRLGNEPETNVELALKYAYSPKGENKRFELIVMRDGFASHGTEFKLDHWAQAYASLHDAIGSADIWYGRRYYDRKSIHIMNHYWLNPGQNSQTGGGIEDIQLPHGSLDLAWFKYRDKNAPDTINSQTLDIRWRNITLNSRTRLTFWAQLAERKENVQINIEKREGYAAGLWSDSINDRIKNTFSLSWQSGASITQGDFRPEPVREDQRWNLNTAYTYELNNALHYEINPDFAMQWSSLVRHEHRGISTNSDINWYSTGIRPVTFLSKHMSLALELGADYIDDQLNNRKGYLFKQTIALQLAPDKGFYKRPVLRLFVTNAEWSDEFKTLIANSPDDAPYGDDTNGWSAGMQLEWWW